MIGLVLGAASQGFGCSGSSYLGTPRAEDAPAIQEYASLVRKQPRKCDRRVDLYEPAQVNEGEYTTVGTISATCYPGVRAACERTLIARACELDADIVVVVPSAPGVVPVGASKQSISSITARALRLKRSSHGRTDAG